MDDVDDENYLMDHTICIFLLDPHGKVMEYFTQYKAPGEIIFTTLQRKMGYNVSYINRF